MYFNLFDLTNPLTLLLSIVAALAVLALIIYLIVFLVKPSAGRDAFRMGVPLNLLARRKKKNHLFLGMSPYSKRLAAQILDEWKKEKKKKDHGSILFIDLNPSFNKTVEHDLQAELDSGRITVLNGNLIKTEGTSLARSIDLAGLKPWLANPRTNLYLFSEKKEENAALLSLATNDTSIKAKVFFYASSPTGLDALIASTGRRVRLLNPHQMAFMHVKLSRPELLPVHYVKKALDADGKPLGYVQDGLHAWVIGFGHTGQEAFRFLYEFGSFVGKDYKRAPMSIDVFDPQVHSCVGAFLESLPAAKGDNAFRWNSAGPGMAQFWEAFEKDTQVDYLVVAVDEGPRNIEIGIALLQNAVRSGKDVSRMVILIHDASDNRKYREVLEIYNAAYCPEGTRILHSFGHAGEIWNSDVLSGRKLKKAAMAYNAEQAELGLDEPWEERKKRLAKADSHSLKNQMELRRRQALDISHALYAPTLLALTPEGKEDGPHNRYLQAQEELHRNLVCDVMGYTSIFPEKK